MVIKNLVGHENPSSSAELESDSNDTKEINVDETIKAIRTVCNTLGKSGANSKRKEALVKLLDIVQLESRGDDVQAAMRGQPIAPKKRNSSDLDDPYAKKRERDPAVGIEYQETLVDREPSLALRLNDSLIKFFQKTVDAEVTYSDEDKGKLLRLNENIIDRDASMVDIEKNSYQYIMLIINTLIKNQLAQETPGNNICIRHQDLDNAYVEASGLLAKVNRINTRAIPPTSQTTLNTAQIEKPVLLSVFSKQQEKIRSLRQNIDDFLAQCRQNGLVISEDINLIVKKHLETITIKNDMPSIYESARLINDIFKSLLKTNELDQNNNELTKALNTVQQWLDDNKHFLQ